jgi:hypothetical protein
MHLDYFPLLQVQRDLQGLPRDFARFKQYLRTILNHDRVELAPLGIMNPMGKDHVTALLDALLALDADGIGARAAAAVSAVLTDTPGDFKIALVVVDDLMGGWTNRYDYEFNLRFGAAHHRFERDPRTPSGYRLPRWLKDFWLTAVLWSSEPASAPAVREAVLLTAYRFAYTQRHGPARTLRDMLTQEGHVMATVGCTSPVLDEEDIDYTREVLLPFMDADNKRTCMECLFGDAAGRTLGFTPRGLSPWAGLALALHDAREKAPQCGRGAECRDS